jgi:DNA invertase Pin-like site-specific DNA recombinase
MLTVLGGLAEFERHLILSRTDEVSVRPKARGVSGSGATPSSPALTVGSLGTDRARRDLGRDCEELQRQSHDGQQAGPV